MAILVGIAILAVVIFYMNRQSSARGGAAIPGIRKSSKHCAFERVNPDETRMLKEYRCAFCSDIAYGRGDSPPSERTCRAQ
ncbi:MAG: hypothetical protein AAFR53_09060 [Pseudomonadota bacterium]